MRRRRCPLPHLALLAALLFAGACGGGGSSPGAVTRTGCTDAWPAAGKATSTGPVPLLVNSDLAAGDSRLILGLLDAGGYPVGDPAWSLGVTLYDLAADGCTPFADTAPLTFAWSINKVRGFFIGGAPIPAATRDLGLSIVGTNADGGEVRIRFAATVKASGYAPRPGQLAPKIATPTAGASAHGLAGITTDPSPEPRLYERSADALIAEGRPFMLAFASPAFCVSQACGPTLATIKEAAAAYPDVAIIHVEPYETEWNGTRLVPLSGSAGLQPNAVTEAWQVPIEPWIFTVGGDGRVLRSLEGVVSLAELKDALAELAATP